MGGVVWHSADWLEYGQLEDELVQRVLARAAPSQPRLLLGVDVRSGL
jgi:hypothetical protein